MSSNITRGRQFGVALAKALGYDTDFHKIKSLTVTWRADGPPLIRITEFATVEQEENLVALVAAVGDVNVQAVR